MVRKKITQGLNSFARWRFRHIGNNTFLIVAAMIVGVITSLLAVLLKIAVTEVHEWVKYGIFLNDVEWMYLFYPLLGILICTFYVQIFLHGDLGRGTGLVLLNISRKNSNVERHKLYSQLVSSVLTVGFGGSAGLEAPIVVTGSAYGSAIGNTFRMTYREKTLLIACGSAAGISAIFNCPIAGVIFAMEVILARAAVTAFIPILIASATSAVVSKILFSGQPFFRIVDDWNLTSLPYFVILGLICGLLSVYNIKAYSKGEEIFSKIKNPYVASLICGGALGILVFIFPSLYGEGYNIVTGLFHGDFLHLMDQSPLSNLFNGPWSLVIIGTILMMGKVFATSFTIGGGGNGGMFGSSLYAGAFLGLIFTQILRLTGVQDLNTVQFIAVAMAGLLSGVIHAPLTAIFLIAEITGGYALFVPLMIVAALSYFVSRYFEPYSIYTRKLAQKGLLAVDDPDREVLYQMRLSSIVETDFATIPLNGKLDDLINQIPTSKRHVYPVVDAIGLLHGIILLDDVKQILFKREEYTVIRIQDIMSRPPAILDVHEDMSKVMKIFEDTGAWNLPVTDQGKYIGFVSKSNIFTKYRRQLIRDLQREEL
ncbi:chloride channel protein [soil metagenome]